MSELVLCSGYRKPGCSGMCDHSTPHAKEPWCALGPCVEAKCNVRCVKVKPKPKRKGKARGAKG